MKSKTYPNSDAIQVWGRAVNCWVHVGRNEKTKNEPSPQSFEDFGKMSHENCIGHPEAECLQTDGFTPILSRILKCHSFQLQFVKFGQEN